MCLLAYLRVGTLVCVLLNQFIYSFNQSFIRIRLVITIPQAHSTIQVKKYLDWLEIPNALRAVDVAYFAGNSAGIPTMSGTTRGRRLAKRERERKKKWANQQVSGGKGGAGQRWPDR